ncbi:MAG: hypothetical protein J6L69_06965 [Lachnospiraceae bacterium]|nr:hypothetical protein [Lachnospiraceae bacterium]
MGRVSNMKIREENANFNKLLSLRVGVLAMAEIALAIVADITCIIFNCRYIDFCVGIISAIIVLYGINCKWIARIKNKEVLQNMIDYSTGLSITMFALEKMIVGYVESMDNKVMVVSMLVAYLISLVSFLLYCSRKKWKYKFD